MQHAQRVDVAAGIDAQGRSSPACSGLMYSSVPTMVPYCVNSVRSVSFCSVALATPKSIHLGTGLPS